MPAIENADASSGRVTRSLRKRLTSIDTDSSSRPGTPVLSSLQILQEAVTVTPSKRTTRRTSISTPVPTPSKVKSRIDATEAVSSPARRSTRRRSNEPDDTATHTRSKEPAFDVVREEETAEKSPEIKSKGSPTVSPRSVLILQHERHRSETPNSERSKTSDRQNRSPTVSPQILKHMQHSKVMLKKEHIDEPKSKNSRKKQEVAKDITPQKNSSILVVSSPESPVVEKKTTPPKPLETSPKSDKNTSMGDTPSKKGIDESPKEESTHIENETTLSATEVVDVPLVKKRGRPKKLKNVGFNNTMEEDVEKSVFPKTPGLTKSKSYILDSSKPDESTTQSESKLEEDSHEETRKESIKDDVEDDNELVNTKTPYKLKLNSVESSTPIQSTSAKKSKGEVLSAQKDTTTNASAGSKEDLGFPKSWSQSVSGTVNSMTKIDSIESEESALRKLEEEKAIQKRASISKSTKPKRSVDDDSDEDLLEEDDHMGEEEEEEREGEKSMFVDDEAMEVAEGEESMDEEERAYLEENEIPVYAESIGSEDTAEEECEEEADEEDAAFVVSDTEEIVHEETDSENGKNPVKKYKRIVRELDSSDEETDSKKENDNDICLVIESSIDENISISSKEKVEEMDNAKTLKDSNKNGAHGIENPEEEKSLSVLLNAVKSHAERRSLMNKEENSAGTAVARDDIKGRELGKSGFEGDKDMIVAETKASDGILSTKERRSLRYRKNIEAEVEQKSPTVSQGDNVENDENAFVNNPNESESPQNAQDGLKDTGDGSDAGTGGKLDLSKIRRRRSLSLAEDKEADREFLKTPAKDNVERSGDKPENSPYRRKSLKKQEEVLIEDVNRNGTETEDQRSFIEVDTDVPSRLSKNERNSLNKSKSDASKDMSMSSPYKRKSIKSNEDHKHTGIDDIASEVKSPRKSKLQEGLDTQSETGTPKSKKERKSINSFQMVQELGDQDIVDVEMVTIEKTAETEKNKSPKTQTKDRLKNMSLNQSARKREKGQKDSENKEKDSDEDIGSKFASAEFDEEPHLLQNESFQETVSDPDKEQDPKAVFDADNESDHVNSSAGSDKKCSPPKSPHKSSPLKTSRKSLNQSCAAELSHSRFKGVSEKSRDTSNLEKDEGDDGEEPPLNVSQNSLNTSKNKKRKSLQPGPISPDAEVKDKFERSANKSKLEKSILFVEEDSEADTELAIEASANISPKKSHNSPKINRKSLNQSISSPRISCKTASPRKTIFTSKDDSETDEKNVEKPVSEEENEENDAEMSKVMEFLGEEEHESNSPPNLNSTLRKSFNKSKLDETFRMELNNSGVSRRDSLHRNVLRKSINRSTILSASMKKTDDINNDGDDEEDTDVSAEFSSEEEVEIVKKVLPDKGLSVSLSGIERKKKKSMGVAKQVHKSFTIGVSLRNTTTSPEKNASISSPDSKESHGNVSISEEYDLEKIENTEVGGPYKPSSSLSRIIMDSPNKSEFKTKHKRYSLHVPSEGASQSFVENLSEEKNKLHSKRSRKSNSFCGASDLFEAQLEISDLSKTQTQSGEPSKSETKTDIQRILSRCDEILEAANQAKREAKLNAKKAKVKKPKWMNKEEKVKEEEETKIPLVSRKEMKRKEKMKKELAKAIKHSTAMLKTIDPKLVKKLNVPEVKTKPVIAEEAPISSKRLPADFLNELEEEAPKPKKKKTKELVSTPPSDKENSKKSSNKAEHQSEDVYGGEKKKKKRSKEIIETASGTVIVEPSTPTKLRFQHGFRESPKTPVGYKIQDIDDSTNKGISKKKAKKLFAASGAFEEKDVKTNNKKAKKRKFQIEEPVYSLPKTQWTSSGVFIEEDIYTVHHPMANSTATQFMVSSLGGSKKSSKNVVSSSTLSTALSFKKNALFSENVKREPGRNLIHRKERKLVNNRY